MPSFCYCLTVQEIYYEKKSLTPILGLGFCMSEKDCNEYRWIVVTFEWILPSFMKLFTICSLWRFSWSIITEYSLFKIFDSEREKFLLLYSFSGKLWGLCQANLMLWSFFNPSWLDYMNLLTLTVRLHVTEIKSHPGMKLVPGWKYFCLQISSRDEIWFERKPPIEYDENV